MRSVYVVTGSTGEYSDHTAWHVRAFTDKAQAEAMCQRLNDWCKEMRCTDGRGKLNYGSEFVGSKPPEDPEFHVDYTGTTYGILEIPLEE